MTHLSVKNFETFQHYKDRRPPWIKLYQDVLEDYEFTRLQDASRSHLLAIWLLASRYDNRVPYDAEWIGRAILASSPVDLDALINAGFLTVCDSAITSLAARKQSAMLETEVERETETSSSSARGEVVSPAETALAERLGNEGEQAAIRALLALVPHRLPWVAVMAGALDGLDTPQLTSGQLAAATQDFLGNGAGDHPNLRHFRSYLRKAAVTPEPRGLPPYNPFAAYAGTDQH